MGFNIGGGLLAGITGLLETGNPIAGVAMGVARGFGGGNVTGEIGNSALAGLDAQDEAFQISMYGEQIHHQERMQAQSQAFDEMMDEKSEQMREVNTLRDVQMQQRKADSQITKKFIESITG
jgi:hypothetical protein